MDAADKRARPASYHPHAQFALPAFHRSPSSDDLLQSKQLTIAIGISAGAGKVVERNRGGLDDMPGDKRRALLLRPAPDFSRNTPIRQRPIP